MNNLLINKIFQRQSFNAEDSDTAFISDPEQVQALKNIIKTYQELPFYKRFIFRIATLPFSLWSWFSSKNPATIYPEKTTKQDINRLKYFFEHCRPVFFRNVFEVKKKFEESNLCHVTNESPTTTSTTTALEQMHRPPVKKRHRLCLLSNDAPSSEAWLESVFTQIQFSSEIVKIIRDNFTKISSTVNTKNASLVFKLSAALMMIRDQHCLSIADDLMNNTDPVNESDRHILTARFKANVVIERELGPSSIEDFRQQIRGIWQPFNESLWASLTREEVRSLSDPIVFERIIESVLIPDTLMMGMHPLQESILAQRQLIAFNPRIQFIDNSWERDIQRYNGELPLEVLNDFKRRVFNIDYSDDHLIGETPYVHFIKDHTQQYQRVIFDWSCLCSVRDGFLLLQNILKSNRFIYAQENESRFRLEEQRFIIQGKNFRVPGKMPGTRCDDLSTIENSDCWFVTQAKHPYNNTLPAFCAYQRTNLPLEKKKIVSSEATPELIAKAKLKLKDPEYATSPERVISLLTTINTNGLQAAEAVRIAQIEIAEETGLSLSPAS